MDQMTEVTSAVKDLHSSNTQLLDRFKNIVIDGRHSDCKEGAERVQAEVTDLKQRFSMLEDGRNIHAETINTLADQLKDIKERVETLNKTLAIDSVVNKPEHGTKQIAGTRKTNTGDLKRLKGSSDTGASGNGREEASGNIKPTMKHDRARLQSNQAFRSKDIHPQERAVGNACDEILTTRTPEVVKQNTERINNDVEYWRNNAALVLNYGKQNFRDLQGAHTVICLDISESMTDGNAWSEALCFLNGYLTGLEEMATLHGLSNEYMALVTFGHETKVQQLFTNNFKDIKRVVNELRLGGPSALFGGLFISYGVLGSSDHQIARTLHGVNVQSKLVLITDGCPTENDLRLGPDVADPSKLDETKATILRIVTEYNVDFICIPVGDSKDGEFLKLMVDMASGQLLDYKSGKRVSRNYYLHTKLLDQFGLFDSEPITVGLDAELSAQDKEDMKFIQQRSQALVGHRSAQHSDMYRESQSKLLPVIGSRVRRGPDWHWGEQDSNGPGTVVGHETNDVRVWITWDENGRTNVYHYGTGQYDVLLVDEPRKLGSGQTMAVGCIVKPGKDWKDTSRTYRKGTVIEIRGSNNAVVRWENGDRNTYTFNGRDGQEIEVHTSGFEPFHSDGHLLGYSTSSP